MYYSSIGILSALGLLILMILLVALGNRFGMKKASGSGMNITEGAVFTLMALLVAFTFSSASQRFDQRRVMIIDEANAVSTAYSRLDLLAPDDSTHLKNDFKRYIDSRLNVYQLFPDIDAVYKELKQTEALKITLWHDAVSACEHSKNPSIGMLILPPINAMFDIASTRIAYSSLHPPYIVFSLLFLVACLSAFLIGYSISGKRTWLSVHVISYAVIMTLTIYIIMDIEVPRFGFIKESSFDTFLIDVRNSMSD